jgi:pimeloyl-ACP methyl ester carboxylesterase
MAFVTSKDGTRIAYETMGSGPPLILVDGAMCYRDLGPMRPLAEALEDRFTVILYDRRGRGESGNTLPYAPEREIDDLATLIDGPGEGSVFLYGCSSGGALAAEAAAAMPEKVKKLIVYEMPAIVDESRDPLPATYAPTLDAHVTAGRNGAAVKQFLKFVGVPGLMLMLMPLMAGKAWRKMTAIAPTLRYDTAIMSPYQRGKPLPAGIWQSKTADTLVAAGGKSPAWMRNAQGALARDLHARYQTLPGQTHMVKAEAQAPMIKAFFAGA